MEGLRTRSGNREISVFRVGILTLYLINDANGADNLDRKGEGRVPNKNYLVINKWIADTFLIDPV
jgi:hypothetical protein